ncbi:hypothetical protein Tco_0227872, partial [Tanacetum coccineum]
SDSEDSIVTYTAVSCPFGGPTSLDYVPGLEYPPSPEFVPEPVYLKFMPPKDEVLPAEEQPLPIAISPTADSLGYVPEFDPEEDPEEDDDEDPTDYPTNKDDDDKEEEPSRDKADDEEEDKDDEEEEEHPAPADFVPPPIPSPPLSVSPPPPANPTYPFGYQAAMIRLRAKALSTSHSLPLPSPIILSCTRSDAPPSWTTLILPIPLPTSSPSLLLSSTDHGADRPEVCLPPRKRLCFAFGPRLDEIQREREVGYVITHTWDEMLEDMPGAPVIDETKLGWRMTNFITTVRHDTDEIYVRLREARDEREARPSREGWGWSMDASDLAHFEVMALHTQVVAQQSEIVALRAADRAQQAQLMETLRLMSTLQTQVTALLYFAKMAPKRTTRANPADTTATTSVTDAQLKAIIDQGVTDALAARDVYRNTNGDDSHNSGTCVIRME